MTTPQLQARHAPHRIRVLKFGGTSMGTTPDQLRRIAKKVADARAEGSAVVAVVSARGKTTDRLLDEARLAGTEPPARELDQLLATGEAQSAAYLAIALHDLGLPAVSLLGAQAGITVGGPHADGRVEKIDTTRLQEVLDIHGVAVVAGFQGANARGDMATLGRGGSDTSAVALAIALGAECCEIYTDVDGVYTADPRAVSDARPILRIGNSVMAELAFAGARVLHPRSVELAGRAEIDIKVISSFTAGNGTTVVGNGKEGKMLEDGNPVTAIAHDADSAQVTVGPAPEDTAEADLFAALASASVTIDAVAKVRADWEFTVRRSQTAAVRDALAAYPGTVRIDPGVAKVSLVGQGLLSSPDSVSRGISVLSASGIRPLSVSASQNRIAIILPESECVQALTLLHAEFLADEASVTDIAELAVA